jgi:hypothetical protein
LCGIVLSLLSLYQQNQPQSGFAVTLVLVPVIVQTIILLVNGNIGIGVAVAGTFSLIRFRSLPLSARHITLLFASMAAGLATGTGCVGIAITAIVIFSVIYLLLVHFHFGQNRIPVMELKITLPEDGDYNTLFNEILDQYTSSYSLTKVKTTDMGSLFEVTYQIKLLPNADTKKMIDQLRIRNSNLSIMLRQYELSVEE